MDEVILFTHIPKSGGTSLRFSINSVFEPEELIYTYGEPVMGRALFHKEAKEGIDNRKFHEHDKLVNEYLAEDDKIKLIYGHFTPYVDSIPSRKVRAFTMFRHPFTRYISLYNHVVRYYGETKEFSEWLKRIGVFRRSMNLDDSKKELEKYEHVLFYEAYNNALSYLSGVFDKELKEMRENITKIKTVHRSPETDKLIEERIPDALRLYDFLTERFG